MDLSTIKRKLDAGQYSNPWEVCMALTPSPFSITLLCTGTTSRSVFQLFIEKILETLEMSKLLKGNNVVAF